jgi:microcystin-dependent protein
VVLSDPSTAVAYTNAGSGTLNGRSYPHGAGDGSTTFNVPELRGEFVRGWAHSRSDGGDYAARAFGDWQPATLTPVDTTMTAGNVDAMGIGPSGAILQSDSYDTDDYPDATYNRVNGDIGQGDIGNLSDTPANATAVHPRNVALMYCIKY